MENLIISSIIMLVVVEIKFNSFSDNPDFIKTLLDQCLSQVTNNVIK